MILTDYEIRQEIANDNIGINPGIMDYQIQPCSIDLRLGRTVIVSLGDHTINFYDQEAMENYESSLLRMKFEDDDEIRLRPNEFMLATTKESISLPSNIVGRVEGKSTFGRCGLTVHVTAGFIDPGFEGAITLELKNLSNNEIILHPGELICQLVLERTSHCYNKYGTRNNHYQYQRVATPPRWSKIE